MAGLNPEHQSILNNSHLSDSELAIEPVAPLAAVILVQPEVSVIVALYGLHPTYITMMSPVVVPVGIVGVTEVLPSTHALDALNEIAIFYKIITVCLRPCCQ